MNANDAARLVEAGVDGVQLDKVSPVEVAQLVPRLKAINPQVTLIAAAESTRATLPNTPPPVSTAWLVDVH